MENINIKHLLKLLLFASFFLFIKSNILSPANKSIPPEKNPIKATNQAVIFKLLAIAIEGSNKDQNDAAIITPAANPSIASITFLLTLLKNITTAAPNIVIAQVNKVAIKA